MSLMSEIQALRAEIQAPTHKQVDDDKGPGAPPAADKPQAASSAAPHTVDAFLKTLNQTLDGFADTLDKYPRLTALGIGVAAGVVIGRKLR